jgi:hypothetical protein
MTVECYVCGRCVPMEQVYRCYDCDVECHKECLKEHCQKSRYEPNVAAFEKMSILRHWVSHLTKEEMGVLKIILTQNGVK